MDDDAYRKWEVWFKKWDLVLKVVAPLITVGGLLLGVWQFNKGQIETNKREFKQRVWEKQAAVYLRMGDVVGRIAAGGPDRDQLRKDINEYNSMYWGVTNYVDDQSVEAAMAKLYQAIRALDEDPTNQSNVETVKVLAQQLVKTCRQANNKFWFEETRN